jgi:photosystem II stability/assembly factor-like uncharacterized protein
MQMNFLKNKNFENILITLIITAGFLLSAYQFFYNRSLWWDEAAVALNILNRTHISLLQPLDIYVIAPILYLQIEKLFSELISNSELGLRLFSILSFWLSILIFSRIMKIIHNNYFTIILSLIIFIFNYRLIYYASELKPYMTDIMVLTSVYYLIIRKYKDEKNKYYYLGIAGAISIFLSLISSIILFTVFVYLLYNYFTNNKKHLSLLLSMSALWFVLFLIYYFSFIYKHPTMRQMSYGWAFAFMPLNPFSIEFYKFILDRVIMISTYFFQLKSNLGVSSLYIFILIGLINLFRKKRYDLIILTITPILLNLLLSGLKLYAFDTRLILYTFPLFIIIFSFGIDFSYAQFLSKIKIERIMLILISIVFLKFTLFTINLPIQREEIKKSLLYMKSKLKKGDKLYLYYLDYVAFDYYKKIKYIDNNFPSITSITLGKWHTKNKIKFIEDFKNFDGRYWLLFTHFNKNDNTYIIRKLDSLGFNRLDEYKTVGSEIYLYDFNRQWQYANGPYGGMNITCLETAGKDIFAGTKEGGVFLTTDNGENWTDRNKGLTTAYVSSLVIDKTNVLVGTKGGGVFLTKNKGASWTAMNNGLKNLNVHSLIISGSNMFAGTNRGIFLSTNEGESWTAKSNGLIKSDVYALATGGSYIFAGTGRGVFLSTDNGGSWRAVNSGLTSFNINSIVISRENIFAGTDGGIFLSTNNGAVWTAKNNGLINLNVHSIIISGENIYAGTEEGVFLSSDNGEKWKAMNEGLQDCYINILAISRTSIFAGSLNKGVWKRINWN